MATPVTQFPASEMLLVNHVTHKVMDLQPLMALLFEKYDDDKAELVEALYQVRDYLMLSAEGEGSAAALRRVYGIINTLAVAFDGITVKQLV